MIKYAGNMLKSFATSISLIATSLLQVLMLGYQPTPLFWVGVGLVCAATMGYAAPAPQIRTRPPPRLSPGRRTGPALGAEIQ